MDILRLMLEAIIEIMSDLAIDLNEAMDQLEDSKESIHDKRRKLSEHRREMISVRRYLIPQREALLRMPFDKLPWLGDIQKISLRESADSTTRILEDLESARDRANLLQEELMNATQEQINKKMFLLSIVAVIFMPLSFITGLLGINVGGIPGAGDFLSFWVVCLILLILGIAEICILKFLKWL
jgi:zinc transporter